MSSARPSTTEPLLRLAAAAGLAATLAAGGAQAQTRTGQFDVRAQVNADCQIATRELNFGVYDAAQNRSGNTTFDITCTPGANVTLSFDGGVAPEGNQRRMSNGTARLNYQIYKDNALQDPIPVGGLAQNIVGTGQAQVINVYGQIPSGQAAAQGNYTDTVRITAQY